MHRSRRFLLGILAAACCTAWAAESRNDVEYAHPDGQSLKLDASIPDGNGPFPTVIIVHGGAWRAGHKQFRSVKPLFEPLSKAGFAWFSINYRLAPKRGSEPEPSHPNYLAMQVEDVETAVKWVKAHAVEYKVDVQRIALIGESAGAHLIAMVAAQDKPATRVAAAVPFYGPFDLETLASAVRQAQPSVPANVFAELVGAVGMDDRTYTARVRAQSPITYVHAGIPPFLLIHGTADKTVPFSQSPTLCEKIKSVQGSCEIISVEGADHGIGKWEENPAFQAYKAKMIEWLRMKLRVESASRND